MVHVSSSAQHIAVQETPGVTPMDCAAQIGLRPAIGDIVCGQENLAVATVLARSVPNA
jgi:hypothetical protein